MGIADIQRKWATKPQPGDFDAHRSLLTQGGFSRNIRTGESPTHGYMVGLHSDLGGEEAVHHLDSFSPQHVADHRQRAAGAASGTNHEIYQGGWAHDGHAYLDRSVNVKDHDEAVALGHKHKQLAIYDVAGGKEEPLG